MEQRPFEKLIVTGLFKNFTSIVVTQGSIIPFKKSSLLFRILRQKASLHSPFLFSQHPA
jgi:hypothetical protein